MQNSKAHLSRIGSDGQFCLPARQRPGEFRAFPIFTIVIQGSNFHLACSEKYKSYEVPTLGADRASPGLHLVKLRHPSIPLSFRAADHRKTYGGDRENSKFSNLKVKMSSEEVETGLIRFLAPNYVYLHGLLDWQSVGLG